jgi:excisionase family DNA binding protein
MKKQPRTRVGQGVEEQNRTTVAPQTGLLTMDEAIALLKTTRPTFYRWVRAGKLRGTKVGRQWRFTAEDVDRFLKGQEPRIDLQADIDPLTDELTSRLKALGIRLGDEGPRDKVDRAIHLMIHLATAINASDIHIEPREGGVQLRLRVDGALHLIARFDLRLLPVVVERWKMMAAMDVREKALPQDGRTKVSVDGKSLELVICCVPAFLGEAVTARLLPPESLHLDLNRLPYAPSDRQRIDRWLAAPWGVILITGPTGCGKTTTLYSCLLKVADIATKAVSIEDPVEYVLPGVTQVQVSTKAGLTFERALRSVLRTDPDIIMVGEIQNAEAMQLCLQAASTGHLVLTTLHVGEAAAALRRMLDLGCEPFLVADATKLIIAQRLVRQLCPQCSVEAAPSTDQLARAENLARVGGLNWQALPRHFRGPVGCDKCGRLGFRGRTVIAETLEVTPEIAAALRRKGTVEEIRAIAVGQGITTMAADGIRRAAEGQVSLAEVLSAVGSIS